MDILSDINLEGFRFINNLAGHGVWLDRFMIFAADQMGYLMILGVMFLAWKSSNKFKVLIITFGSAIIARAVFVEFIRYFIYSPRPFAILENVNQLIAHEPTSSFPSGHASFFFALAMGVYLYNKKAGTAFLWLAALIGFARIFTGVHWPLDILAGAGLGVVTAILVNYLKQKMSQRTFAG